MPRWEFCCYVSPTGREPIHDWYRGLTHEERSVWMDVVEDLSRREQWHIPAFRRLTGAGGLGEIRFVAGRKQDHMIGVVGPGFRFTCLVGCTHKQQRYNPPSALDTADRRRRELESGRGARSKPYDLERVDEAEE